jgi:DNA-binding NtrC family response regulator
MHELVSKSLNILIVEARDDRALALVRLLNADGHTVARAGTLAEAHVLCEVGRFDLLIAWHRLPDGPECELMQEMSRCHTLPGILVSEDGESRCSAAMKFRAQLIEPLALPAVRAAIARATRV